MGAKPGRLNFTLRDMGQMSREVRRADVCFRKGPPAGSTDRMGTVIWVRCGKCQTNLRRG